MKREMSSLRKCFGQALADLGGLEALPDLDARVAAGAMDERINRYDTYACREFHRSRQHTHIHTHTHAPSFFVLVVYCVCM